MPRTWEDEMSYFYFEENDIPPWEDTLRAERDEARRQLAEAAEAVRLLLEVVRDIRTNDYPWQIDGKYEHLPAWMWKEIER